MEKNILNEIKRVKEIMGLSTLLNEGVPVKLLTAFEKELVSLAKTEKDVLKSVLKNIEGNEIDDALKAIDEYESLSTRGVTATDDEIKAYNRAVETITQNLDIKRYAEYLKKSDVLGVDSSYQKLVKKANEGNIGLTKFEQEVDNLLSDRINQIEDTSLRNEVKKLYKTKPSGIQSEQEIIDSVIRKLETGEDTAGLFENEKFLGLFTREKFKEDLIKLKDEAKKLVQKMDKPQMIEELEQQTIGVLKAIEKKGLKIGPEKLNLIQKFLKNPKLYTFGLLTALALVWLIGCSLGDNTLSFCATIAAYEQVQGFEKAKKEIDKSKKLKSGETIPDEGGASSKKETLTADDLPLPGGSQ